MTRPFLLVRGWGLGTRLVFTCHIEHASLEPVYSSFPHAAIHNLVELLHPSQSPSRQVAPEPLWVLQTLGVQGGMILGHGGQLQRIGYAGGKPRGERFVEDTLQGTRKASPNEPKWERGHVVVECPVRVHPAPFQ